MTKDYTGKETVIWRGTHVVIAIVFLAGAIGFVAFCVGFVLWVRAGMP